MDVVSVNSDKFVSVLVFVFHFWYLISDVCVSSCVCWICVGEMYAIGQASIMGQTCCYSVLPNALNPKPNITGGAFSTAKNIQVQLLLLPLRAAEYDESLKRRALLKGCGWGVGWRQEHFSILPLHL